MDFDPTKYELVQDEDGECLIPKRFSDNPCIEKEINKLKKAMLNNNTVVIDGGSWRSYNAKNRGKAVNTTKTPVQTQDQKDLQEAFARFFNDGTNAQSPKGPPPKPIEYDDSDKSTRINERYPMFGFASLLDEVLDEFGGVEEIMECDWNGILDQGEVVCLMKDWRVFRYLLKNNEFAILSHDDRKSKISRECILFEDMDDYAHWLELGGVREENDKKEMEKKKKQEEMTVYGEKMSDALDDFFNGGGVDAIQKMMQKNTGKS